MQPLWEKEDHKQLWIALGVTSLVIIAVLIVIGIAVGGENKPQTEPTSHAGRDDGVYKGFGYSPRSGLSSDSENYFNFAQQGGEAIVWSGNITELTDTTKQSLPHQIIRLAAQEKFIPLITLEISPHQFDDEELLEALRDFTLEYRPLYLGIGSAINHPDTYNKLEYRDFVETFSKVQDSIREVSPQTHVFAQFDYEYMVEFKQWSLLLDFPQADALAFQSFPYTRVSDPQDIPSSHYSQLSEKTDKEVFFTGIGWHSTQRAGLESSEAEQAQFVSLFFERTEQIRPRFVIWQELYDQSELGLGMRNDDDSARSALQRWLEVGYFDEVYDEGV